MLRYYEQVGLIQSIRKENYAYRVYDETAIIRLQQIIVLRKLRIPVKQIISILDNTDAVRVVEVFRQNISQLNNEITALSTIKSILTRFVEEINEKADVRIVYLPPMTVATISATGEGCEGKALEITERFIKENNLLKVKPDIRQFGFDCSMGAIGVGENSHKYQVWVSIPDDIEVTNPFIKRNFMGGLYASHMIKMGDFFITVIFLMNG